MLMSQTKPSAILLDVSGLFLKVPVISLELAAQRDATDDSWGRDRDCERVMNGCSSHRPAQNVWNRRARQVCPARVPRCGELADPSRMNL